MPDVEQIGAQRWHAVVDDMSALGSWCVMNTPKTPVHSDPAAGEIQIARYLSEGEARQMVDLHNAGLAGHPRSRPDRYRVQMDDVLIFDELGATLNRAQEMLEDAEATPDGYLITEIRHHRAVLREVLAALSLLTEGAIRLRAEPDPREAVSMLDSL